MSTSSFIRALAIVGFLAASACSTSPAAAAQSARGATVRGLRAEIVPTTGGMFPSSAVDPDGKPVRVPWVLRITNTTDAPIVFRTGGDDESFVIDARGGAVGRATNKAPCPEIYFYGKKNVIPAKGSFDVPVVRFATGARCADTALYLTKPGPYSVDVSLVGHIHPSPSGTDDRGDKVQLDAPTINVQAS